MNPHQFPFTMFIRLLVTGQWQPIYLKILSGKTVARSYLARMPHQKKVILHPNAPPLPTSYHPTNLKSIIWRSYALALVLNMEHKPLVSIVCVLQLEEISSWLWSAHAFFRMLNSIWCHMYIYTGVIESSLLQLLPVDNLQNFIKTHQYS